MAFRPLHTASELHRARGRNRLRSERRDRPRDRRGDPRAPQGPGPHSQAARLGRRASPSATSARSNGTSHACPIGVLKSICDVFGIHMNWFFRAGKLGPPEERDIVVRAANRPRLSFTGLGITEELLSPNLTGQLELLISTIAPGADSDDYSHDGVGGRRGARRERSTCGSTMSTSSLETGDSFAFASTQQHRCANRGTDVPRRSSGSSPRLTTE